MTGVSDAREMLQTYRQTTKPEWQPMIESFKRLTMAERDELLFYGILHATQQYAAVLASLNSLIMGAKPQGKAN